MKKIHFELKGSQCLTKCPHNEHIGIGTDDCLDCADNDMGYAGIDEVITFGGKVSQQFIECNREGE
jgi:hypothetical protein